MAQAQPDARQACLKSCEVAAQVAAHILPVPFAEPVDEEEETESLPIRRMAIPVWSAAQIAESAKNQGDAPDIVKDDITKVTLFDYSDIVAGAKPASAEKQN